MVAIPSLNHFIMSQVMIRLISLSTGTFQMMIMSMGKSTHVCGRLWMRKNETDLELSSVIDIFCATGHHFKDIRF